MNGVVIQDNIRGTPNNLFIEDAIQETTTSTLGVSAEYGRFTGGVVNTITKSGGNAFCGSFRTTFTNDAWHGDRRRSDATTHVDKVDPDLRGDARRADLEGPRLVLRRRPAPRTHEARGQTRLHERPLLDDGNDEKRYEGKLTVTPVQNHTFTGSYIDSRQRRRTELLLRRRSWTSHASTTASFPQEILAANYNGVLTSKLFLEGHYSRRKFTFENSGSALHGPHQGHAHARPLARQRAVQLADVLRRLRPRGRATTRTSSSRARTSSPRRASARTTSSSGTTTSPARARRTTTSRAATTASSRRPSSSQGGDIFPVIDDATRTSTTPRSTRSARARTSRTHSVFLNDTWRLNERLSVQPRRPVGQERRHGQPRRHHGGRQRLQPAPRRDLGRHGQRAAPRRRELREVRRRPSRRRCVGGASNAGGRRALLLVLRRPRDHRAPTPINVTPPQATGS